MATMYDAVLAVAVRRFAPKEQSEILRVAAKCADTDIQNAGESDILRGLLRMVENVSAAAGDPPGGASGAYGINWS